MTATLDDLLLEGQLQQAGASGVDKERAHCGTCGRFVPLASVRGQLRTGSYWELGWEDFRGRCVVHGDVEVTWGGA